MAGKLSLLAAGLLAAAMACAEVVCTFPADPPAAPPARVPNLRAGRLAAAPAIDGDLGDPAWRGAAGIDGFVWLRRLGNVKLQSFANQEIAEQAAIRVSQPTRVRVGYDDRALYVAFDCSEARMNELRAIEPEGSRFVWQDDCVQVLLQPHPELDERHWQIILSAAGVTQVSVNLLKSGAPRQLDFEYAVRLEDGGWTAELAIPFAALGEETPGEGASWRVNFCREEQPFKEVSSWSEALTGFHEPENFGRLYFGGDARPEIAGVEWGGAGMGLNRMTAQLFNPSAGAAEAVAELFLDGEPVGSRTASLPPSGSVAVEWTYRVDRVGGELELRLGNEFRRWRFEGRELAGALDTTELINPAAAVTGTLELPFGELSLGDCALEWSVDGEAAGTTAPLTGRRVLFEAALPALEPGEHRLRATLLKDGAVAASVELPFAILPGLFDDF